MLMKDINIPVKVDVHHSHRSQCVRRIMKSPDIDSEATWTASEDDQIITPAQREPRRVMTSQNRNIDSEDWNSKWSENTEEIWTTMDIDSSRKREMCDSTEEETDVIKIGVGSFVISKFGGEKKK